MHGSVEREEAGATARPAGGTALRRLLYFLARRGYTRAAHRAIERALPEEQREPLQSLLSTLAPVEEAEGEPATEELARAYIEATRGGSANGRADRQRAAVAIAGAYDHTEWTDLRDQPYQCFRARCGNRHRPPQSGARAMRRCGRRCLGELRSRRKLGSADGFCAESRDGRHCFRSEQSLDGVLRHRRGQLLREPWSGHSAIQRWRCHLDHALHSPVRRSRILRPKSGPEQQPASALGQQQRLICVDKRRDNLD